MEFQVNRSYDPGRDVRANYGDLETKLRQQPPDGALWLIVAPRRGRKTWTLKAMERALAPASRFLDLRDGNPPASKVGHAYLLDEPLAQLKDSKKGRALLDRCARLVDAGSRVTMAVTPRELQMLLDHDAGRGRVSEKALLNIPFLTADEAATLARTPRARAILTQLPAEWKRSAFFLELLFEVDESKHCCDWRLLLRAVLEECRRAGINYFNNVFIEGLTDGQRAVVRRVTRGEIHRRSECGRLIEAGLIDWNAADNVARLADPILDAHFSSLRIHHVSDVHVGPKSATSIDIKVGGPLANAADPGVIRETYVQHLRALKARGLAPHLVIVSGDLAESATEVELTDARAWVDSVRAELDDHLQLSDDDPRILLVGGNHDVDWAQTRDKSPSARHMAFARAFDKYRRPLLEKPPGERTLAMAAYLDFGVEIALLGSAEFGGEVDDNQQRVAVECAKATNKPADCPLADKLMLGVSRDDPGLVHAKDLQRVKFHKWCAPVRIAVLHHPVSPMPQVTEIARYSGLLNAGAVKDTLMEREFCLILHGHAHAGWFGVEQWPGMHGGRWLRIAAAPSLSSREVPECRGYNAIEIERDHDDRGEPIHRVIVRRYVLKGQSWEPEERLGPFTPGA
ncbi:MAG TPA: metallophosphoesterase [Polyangiaceae bacterium]|jgi:3',5'-cyclic AMP phosphodiesterase CpdA